MATDVHNLSLMIQLNFWAIFGLTFFKWRRKRQAVTFGSNRINRQHNH